MVGNRRTGVGPLQKFVVFVIERIPASAYLAIFVGVIVLCAYGYYKLTPWGHGIAGAPDEELTFWDALYFSLVTVSSLGYGDIHPIGASKAIACAEVLFGLFTVGVVIAKATSFRLSYHVERLFSSSINERMQGFSQEFDRLHQELVAINQMIGASFDVPMTNFADQVAAQNRFARAVDTLHGLSSNVADYVALEIDYGRFFLLVPPITAERVAASMEQTFYRVGTMIRGMGPAARDSLIGRENRVCVQKAVEREQTLHALVLAHCHPGQVRQSFAQLHTICTAMPEQYFAVPDIQPSQPNLQPSPDNPQVVQL